MGNIIEKTKYHEAYKCENDHIIPKYRQYGNFPVMDSMAFHKCCPECGSKDIFTVTGIWEREYVMTENLFRKKRELVRERFIKSVFSCQDEKLKLSDKVLVDKSIEK